MRHIESILGGGERSGCGVETVILKEPQLPARLRSSAVLAINSRCRLCLLAKNAGNLFRSEGEISDSLTLAERGAQARMLMLPEYKNTNVDFF